MRTAATGSLNGIRLMFSASEAPVSEITSASFSWSAESTYTKSCVSWTKPSGNSGRSGRSISRAERISLSDGRPSRLMYPPGIFPAA